MKIQTLCFAISMLAAAAMANADPSDTQQGYRESRMANEWFTSRELLAMQGDEIDSAVQITNAREPIARSPIAGSSVVPAKSVAVQTQEIHAAPALAIVRAPLGRSVSPLSRTIQAPEIDSMSMFAALTLLGGSLLVLRGRREARSRA